jgi:hypothetical protein
MGRPSKYDPKYCDKIIELMSEGASIEEVCYEWRITKATLYNWTEKHPEFLNSKKIGEQLSMGWWMKKGRELENTKLNHVLWYMNMKNRFGWSDKQEIQHSGTNITITFDKQAEKGSNYLVGETDKKAKSNISST